ncbi:MAG: flippase-like domain-containing protein [Flavobacteriaceae bacterium]|nr:flippase-like domain-containing protein [Flavobacteriaceae bacterium]
MVKLKAILKILVPLSIGLFFIFLTVNATSNEERKLIYSYIKNADYRFLFLSVFFGILSHLSRAYRWKFLLAPLGYKPRFINTVLSVLIAYIANLGIPRSGEILRATTLSSYEKIPFEKTFGTVIAERLVDMIILFSIILLALSFHFELIWNLLKEKQASMIRPLYWFFGGLIPVIYVIRFLFKQERHPAIIKIKNFLKGLTEGILSLKKMPKKGVFIAHTLFIWIMYIAMFCVVKWAVPETSTLGLNALLPAFVIGGLAISASNGGIGIYPFSVALMLATFGVSNESGLAFGWITWIAQTLMIIVFGSLSFFALPLVNRK